MNDECVSDRPRIQPLEDIRDLHVFAVRMTVRIQSRITVEIGSFDDQLVTVPTTRRNAVPARWYVRRPFEIGIQRNPMEPRVLFPQECDGIRMLNNLNSVR